MDSNTNNKDLRNAQCSSKNEFRNSQDKEIDQSTKRSSSSNNDLGNMQNKVLRNDR